MYKNLFYIVGLIILIGQLVACSTPEEKAADYVSNAEILLEKGEYQKAAIEYKNALQINQNLPDAWFGLAKINEQKQEWRKAYKILNKLRELAPEYVDGRIMLAQFLLASNQLDQSLDDAREILSMAPDDARSHALMASVQLRLGNREKTEQEINKALEIDPANPEALLVRSTALISEKKYNEAISVLDKASKLNPANTSFYLMKILAYQRMDNNQGAEAVYLELIDKFPETIAYKNALASHYVRDNRIEDAERVLEQIIQTNPTSVDEKIRFVGFKHRYRSIEDAIALLKTYIDDNQEEYRYRFLLGELYEANDRTEQALSVYQAIVKDAELQPNGLEARNKIALIELRAGNEEKATTLVQEVLAQDKNNENGLLLMAGIEVANQKYDDAVVRARTILRDNPNSIKALALLAQSYDAMGSNELAVEEYTKAFKLSPGTAAIANQLARNLIRQRKFEQADEILQESIEKGNRSRGAVRILAEAKLSQGKWDEAELLAKQLQKTEGQEALSQQVLGIVYQQKEQQDESIAAFKRAHELAPTASQPLVSLIQTYVRDGKINEAKRFLDSVIADDSNNATAYILLGQLSLYEKKVTDAIKNYEKAIEINPKQEASYRALASIYLKEKQLDKAASVINRGLTEMPGQPALAIYLATIYEKQGNYSEAIESYESLLKTNSNSLVAKNNLASLLTDYGGDQASLEKARSIAAEFRDSQIPQFRDTYAWTSVKSGTNVEEAIVILEGIVKDYDQVDVYHYHLGEAYRTNGEKNNAIAYLKKAAELAGPGSDIADKANKSLKQIN